MLLSLHDQGECVNKILDTDRAGRELRLTEAHSKLRYAHSEGFVQDAPGANEVPPGDMLSRHLLLLGFS